MTTSYYSATSCPLYNPGDRVFVTHVRDPTLIVAAVVLYTQENEFEQVVWVKIGRRDEFDQWIVQNLDKPISESRLSFRNSRAIPGLDRDERLRYGKGPSVAPAFGLAFLLAIAITALIGIVIGIFLH